MATKNGSNGRANSIHLMENEENVDETALTLRERWEKFMAERDDYSLWLFPPDHRYITIEHKVVILLLFYEAYILCIY